MNKHFIIFIIMMTISSFIFSQDLQEYIDILHPDATIMANDDSIVIEMNDVDMRDFSSMSTMIRIFLAENEPQKDIFIMVNGETIKLNETILYGTQQQSLEEIQEQYYQDIRPAQQKNATIIQD